MPSILILQDAFQILSSNLRLSLPCGLSPPGFPTKTLHVCLSPLPHIRATWPAHLILVDSINSIWWRVQSSSLRSSSIYLLPTPPRSETACSRTPLASVPPSMTETKFHIIWLLRETTDVRFLVNDQRDAQIFSMYLFLFLTLYMFRAHRAHHQERQIVSIQLLVVVTLCRWQLPEVVLTQFALLMMSTMCSKHVES